VKLGRSADEKFEILPEEYATEVVKKLGILEWHKRFKVGRESVEDTRRGVSTNENRLDENAEKLWGSYYTEKQFSVDGSCVKFRQRNGGKNFKGDLCKKCICQKISQCFLTMNKNIGGVDVCSDHIMELPNSDLSNPTTRDDTYDP